MDANHDAVVLPPEILDQIIDHLHDDKKALRSLTFVCKQTLLRSRSSCFSTLEVVNMDKRLDELLSILDVPWTSFTPCVKRIVFKGLFTRWSSLQWTRRSDMSRILKNLCHVESVWLLPGDAWRVAWKSIPTHIKDLIFRLGIQDLQFYSVIFHQRRHIADFLNRLEPSVIENLVLYDLRGEEMPINLDGSLFCKPFNLRLLDKPSLEQFANVWDQLIARNVDITVKTLYIHEFSPGQSHCTLFLSRFLCYVGPSLQRLCLDISGSISVGGPSWLFDEIDFSKCTNIQVVYIGVIALKEYRTRLLTMVQAMWRLLSALPSPGNLQEISISFSLRGQAPEGLEDLLSFQWLDLVHRLQQMFCNVKKIKFLLAGHRYANRELFLAILRGPGGLGQLEREGIVTIGAVRVPGLGLKPRSPWGEISEL